jgi:hypothetical protein
MRLAEVVSADSPTNTLADSAYPICSLSQKPKPLPCREICPPWAWSIRVSCISQSDLYMLRLYLIRRAYEPSVCEFRNHSATLSHKVHVEVFLYLRTTPWRRKGEEVNGRLHKPAVLPPIPHFIRDCVNPRAGLDPLEASFVQPIV